MHVKKCARVVGSKEHYCCRKIHTKRVLLAWGRVVSMITKEALPSALLNWSGPMDEKKIFKPGLM